MTDFTSYEFDSRFEELKSKENENDIFNLMSNSNQIFQFDNIKNLNLNSNSFDKIKHDNCYTITINNTIRITNRILWFKRYQYLKLLFKDILYNYNKELTCNFFKKKYTTFNNIGNMECEVPSIVDINKMDHKFNNLMNERHNENSIKNNNNVTKKEEYEEIQLKIINNNNIWNENNNIFKLPIYLSFDFNFKNENIVEFDINENSDYESYILLNRI